MVKTTEKSNKSLKLILLAIVVIAIAVYFFANFSSFNSNLFNQSAAHSTYNSQGLNISFQYPQSLTISELGSRSLEVIEPKDNKIKILITKTPMLQNQSLNDYIAVIDNRSKDSSQIISEEDFQFASKNAVRRVMEPMVGADLRKYTIIFVEHNGFVYAISVTPADSELMPVFEEIVKSIKFN